MMKPLLATVIFLTACSPTVDEVLTTDHEYEPEKRYVQIITETDPKVTPAWFKCITVGGAVGCGAAGHDPMCVWSQNEYLCFHHESEWAWVGKFVSGRLVMMWQQRLDPMHP